MDAPFMNLRMESSYTCTYTWVVVQQYGYEKNRNKNSCQRAIVSNILIQRYIHVLHL